MLEIEPGMNIWQAVRKARVHCIFEGIPEVRFKFNDIPLVVSRLSLDDDIVLIYSLKLQLRNY